MKITIPKPGRYYAYMDEYHFFRWLERIKRVTGVKWDGHGLEVTIDGKLDADGLSELIALMTRYELEMDCLQELCLTVDKEQFACSGTYWYDAVFKSG